MLIIIKVCEKHVVLNLDICPHHVYIKGFLSTLAEEVLLISCPVGNQDVLTKGVYVRARMHIYCTGLALVCTSGIAVMRIVTFLS